MGCLLLTVVAIIAIVFFFPAVLISGAAMWVLLESVWPYVLGMFVLGALAGLAGWKQ